jgi:hypothetical protein
MEDPGRKGRRAEGHPRPHPEPRAARRKFQELRPLDLPARKTRGDGTVERLRHFPTPEAPPHRLYALADLEPKSILLVPVYIVNLKPAATQGELARMNEDGFIRTGEFEQALLSELDRLGVPAIPQFHVPGTNLRIDFYIAAPVRAFIEVKRSSHPSGFGLQQVHTIAKAFGGEIVPILITNDSRSSPSPREISIFHFPCPSP